MRQNSQQQTVQIQEPALKEIKKRSGWLTGSCVTGSGCVVLFIAGVYITFRLIAGSGPTIIANFPADFPKDIPQSNPDKMIKITEVDADTKDRALWIATALPRLLVSPVLSELNPDAVITEERDSLSRVTFKRALTREHYLQYLGIQAGDEHTKTVTVTWNGIKTYPSLLVDTFEKQLQRANYKTTLLEINDRNTAAFNFQKGTTSGVFRAVDLHPDEPGIEFVELIVNY